MKQEARNQIPARLARLGSRLHELPLPRPGAGIYFLVRRGKIVYVGESEYISGRITKHISGGRLVFDRVFYLTHSGGRFQRRQVEEAFITHLDPPANHRQKKARLEPFHEEILAFFYRDSRDAPRHFLARVGLRGVTTG